MKTFSGFEVMSAAAGTAVLYVEDDPLIRELAAEALEDAGFDVVVANSGDAALEALDDTEDPFCAVITDVDLGVGADGWVVGKRARELDHDLPVIYVSGASGHEWKSKGVPNSAMIVKPFTMLQLVNAILSRLRKTRGSARDH